jgi:AcrR family transcriptional regulator
MRADRKSTQRARILHGMVETAAERGYAAATIAQVITHAGVSRPTFYEYFTNKDDCFAAAVGDLQVHLLADMSQAVRSVAPECASRAAIATLLDFASAQASNAEVLLNEAMAAGPRALDARDQGVAQMGELIEAAHEQVAQGTATPDLSPRLMIGGTCRLLAAHLRYRERGVTGLLHELLGWIACYEQPAGEHRWRTLEPYPALAPLPSLGEVGVFAPSALGPGRPRMSKLQVTENHRRRILLATASLAQEKGFTATTVADICRAAGVDARVFYRCFADKRTVFGALHEHHFRQVMAVTAGAFFNVGLWPERIWEAGRAFAQCLEQTPTLAHASFIESHAAGPIAVQRVRELIYAFTIFLQEGYEYSSPSSPPSALALEAIATTIFEMGYQQTRLGGDVRLLGLVPHATFIVLAPFLGAVQANGFIQQKLTGGASDRAHLTRSAAGVSRSPSA